MNKIFYAAEHHQVLPYWEKVKSSGVTVITLDHHIDALPEFDFYKKNHKNPPPAVRVEDALKYLRHDEHIDYALKHGLIKKSIIVSHALLNFAVADERIEVRNDGFLTEDKPLNAPELREYFNQALESDFLKKQLGQMPDGPFILDVDFDYFKTRKSLRPTDKSFFNQLCEKSLLITCSYEKDWVRLLSLDSPYLTSEEIETIFNF